MAIREETEGFQIGEEEGKLSLFADDMILYIENPGDFTRTLLEGVTGSSKVAGYKINIQIFAAFLHTNSEHKQKPGNQFHSQLHQKE